MRRTSLTSSEASESRPCRLPEGLPRRVEGAGRRSDDERQARSKKKKENNKTRRDGFVYSAAPKVEAIRRD